MEVVDPAGAGLGVAVGLCELGHEVRYRGAWRSAARRARPRGEAERLRDELVAHVFGAEAQPVGPGSGSDLGDGVDLLVLVDVFADWLAVLERGYEDRAGEPLEHALQDDAGVAVYPERLRLYLEAAARAPRTVVVDLSDRDGPRETAFEGLPDATLLAREGAGDGPWRPFPYLFHSTVLWLEYLQPTAAWLLAERPAPVADWAFCGTLEHVRYGGRRREALRAIAARWPGLRGRVVHDAPFRDVLATLQCVRFGLDLPGAGEVCFRVHECLALGTPVWQPLATRVAWPDGLAPVRFRDPERPPALDAADVRTIYREHYSPRAAASRLLASCAAAQAPAEPGRSSCRKRSSVRRLSRSGSSTA